MLALILCGGIAVIPFCFKSIGYYIDITTALIVCTITIVFAFALPSLRLKHDITYELFLSHWIVLNILINYDILNKVSMFVSLTIFLFGSVILALFVYRVERGTRKLISFIKTVFK